jgi:uncharacterized SAM-binding protein YcdF (DUF218 family)
LRGRVLVAVSALVVLACALAALALWPRDDAVGQPDVVVVLGGAAAERAELGIELADRFEVPLVLSSSAAVFGERLGRDCDEPDTLCIVTDPENTTGEARGAADLADARGWRHVLVVTTEFHTARSRMLFRQCLGDRVAVVGAQRERWVGVGQQLREFAGVVVGATVRRAC